MGINSGFSHRIPNKLLSHFFILAVFLLLWGLGARTLWSSEGRWAEITREMFIRGDFFHPTIGGLPYFDKPLMTYCEKGIIYDNLLVEYGLKTPSRAAGMHINHGTDRATYRKENAGNFDICWNAAIELEDFLKKTV